MRNTFFKLLLVLATAPAFGAWDLNDVSYLMPLPTQVGPDKLLGLDTPARGGALMPSRHLSVLPPMTPVHTEEEVMKAMRVIAVRIDPCFPLPTPQSCQKQLRIVWQPLEVRRNKELHSIDAALHSFYVLEDADFAALLKELADWKVKYGVTTQGLPLQIHPAWVKERDQSIALEDFHKIITRYAGEANLTRLTAMVLRGAGDMWVFAGFEVRNGKLQIATVPRLDRGSQAFVNLAVPADHFEGGQIMPIPNGPDRILQVIQDSEVFQSGQEQVLREEFTAALRIENPKVYNPENMDCVSCHIAQASREWITAKRSDIGIESIWNVNAYMNSRYNLKNLSPTIANTQNIRAFGYFGPDMAVSQRVINESAEVADLVNKFVSGK